VVALLLGAGLVTPAVLRMLFEPRFKSAGVAPANPTVAATLKLGALRQPCHVLARDNGSSARYNGVSYWIFGDGFYG
jgi:hypothetical protein